MNMKADYEKFLESKIKLAGISGIEITEQEAIEQWNKRIGD